MRGKAVVFCEGRDKRLARYFRYLRKLLVNGYIRTNSREIARALELTPSQVRSDLRCFDGAGQQGYGYNVKLLYTAISRELGTADGRKAIVIGGDSALVSYLKDCFEGRGVFVTAAFSQDKDNFSVPVYPIERISDVLKASSADIAVIAELPDGMGASELEALGIKGIWNTTQDDLYGNIPIINLPVGDVVMFLCHEIRKQGRIKDELQN